MAALLKKRALAEFSSSNIQGDGTSKEKKLRPAKKIKREPLPFKEKSPEKTLSSTVSTPSDNGKTEEQLSTLISDAANNDSNVSVEVVKLFRAVLRENSSSVSLLNLYKKLFNIIKEENEEIMKASLVNVVKELIQLERIEDHLNLIHIIEDMLSLFVNNEGKIFIAEVLNTVHEIIRVNPLLPTCELNQRLINATTHLLLNNNSHLVKRQALRLLSDLAPACTEGICDTSMVGQMQSICSSIVKLLRDYSHHYDPRVRNEALQAILKLHEKGVKLDFSLYSEFCEALNDDFENCRMSAIKLLEVLSHIYSDCLVCVNKGEEQIRLVDDAFAKICSMINDLSIAVRTKAASLLGCFSDVSPNFLAQTLQKTLMSNLRKKKSAHERNRESCSAGEWSTGKKWASDAPHEELCPDTINLMDIGACGAFIHGLEDEFMEVRMATLESLCRLAQVFPAFAEQSLDFVVDMFNDEIEDIRLKAIQCLSKISQQRTVLRDDQVEIILSVLEDSSIDIREALHDMLGNCQISSQQALKSCVENLLDNLRKYPEDRVSIWKCFRKIGTNHPELVGVLVTDLLGIHPFLDLTEPSLEDVSYVGVLIMVFNAAGKSPSMCEAFVNHTKQHYAYLRDYHSSLVPSIPLLDKNVDVNRDALKINHDEKTAQSFLLSVFERISRSLSSGRITLNQQTSIIELLIQDLQRLGEIEPKMSHASDFLKQYLQCQICLRKILANNNWINAFLLPPLQSSSFRSALQQILLTTFRLLNQFHGMHPLHLSMILQTRVKALALQLIAVIHGSNASALTLCDAFLEETKTLAKHLDTYDLEPDSLTNSMIKEINALEQPKPGSVARVLQPLFLSTTALSTQSIDLTQLVKEKAFTGLTHIRKTSCYIEQPKERTETPLKFTAGLILTLKLDAVLHNIKDIRNVRLKIHFPDQQTHYVLPKLSDFRLLDDNTSASDTKNYRLYTNVYISHGIWSEPCYVDLNIVLDFRDSHSHLSVSQCWLAKCSPSFKSRAEDSLVIDLCPPVKILVIPKQHRKGVL